MDEKRAQRMEYVHTCGVWDFAGCGLERRSGLNNLVIMSYTNRLDQWQRKMLQKKGFVSGVAQRLVPMSDKP